MRLILCLLLLCVHLPLLAIAPASGLYYDRNRSGHGLDLQVVGDGIYGTFYTFEADGQPIWYQISGPFAGDSGTLTITEYRWDSTQSPAARPVASSPGATLTRVGSDAVCGDGSSRPGARERYDFRFSIAGESLRWCLEPITPASSAPESALSGSWYGGEADSGWGLISYLYGTPGAVSAFHTMYVYDSAGRPRWAYASGAAPSTDFTPAFQYARGYCRSCPASALQPQSAGSASVRLVTPRNDVDYNRIAFDFNYPYGAGGRYARSDSPLRLLTRAPAPPAVVATREGLVGGTELGGGIVRFAGIPYVAPPLGSLRWRAPQAAAPRTRPFLASELLGACPQKAVSDGLYNSSVRFRSEDCLQLNVWTPELREGAGRPVMVWIHGGGLVQGSAVELRPDGSAVYDGAKLADDGVVLVSINYRLGPLGFLAMREFSGEFPDQPAAGNYGLLDQIAALRWVQANISAFGGDPGRVTIFGESAGGLSTCTLMGSPLARGLFHRAIIESGGCLRTLPPLEGGSTSAYTQGERVQGLAGCGSASDRKACMRALSWESLIDATNPNTGFGLGGEKFGFAQDNYALTEGPGLSIQAGRAAPVPMIGGVNNDELTVLMPPSTRPQTVAEYEAQVRAQFPTLYPQVLQVYPASAYPEPWYAYADLLDDLQFACPNAAFTRNHAAAGNATWRYVYTHVFANASAIYGAFHGAELAFVFGPINGATSAEASLSAQMQRQWTRFAASGDPNGGSDPVWPRRLAADDIAIEFDDLNRGLIANYRKSYCDFWGRYVTF